MLPPSLPRYPGPRVCRPPGIRPSTAKRPPTWRRPRPSRRATTRAACRDGRARRPRCSGAPDSDRAISHPRHGLTFRCGGALHPRRAHLALLAVLVAVISCGSDETAILLEVVPGTVDPLSLDEVLFRVTGKGLDGGEGIARAPLHGSGATPFPLSLALRGRAPAAGPFTVDVEGRGGGVLRATASAGAPIAFENGTVVHQRLILHALDEPGTSPDAAAEPGTDRQDAAAATAVDAASGAAADSMMPAPSSGGGQGGGGSHGTGGTAGNDGSGPPSGAGPDGSMGTGGGGAGAGG